MKRQIAVEIIVFFFILLFTYASLTKLADVQKFQVQISQSPLLTNIAVPISWIVPASELGVVALLVIPRFKIIGLILSTALMTAFTVYIALILGFSEEVPCSCGGIISQMKWNEHLVFNIAFVALGILGVVLSDKVHRADSNMT